MTETKDQNNLANQLSKWFAKNARPLPWRTEAKRDPYHVWLAEIMLQQTTVPVVIPFYEKFLALYPTVHDLARSPMEDVLKHWAGLGYYARARNLNKCANVIAHEHKGRFPETVAELLELPGIGPYTAAAIAAIAFGKPATVVDGNVERVITRLHAVKEALPKSKPKLRLLAEKLTPEKNAGIYAEAIMDLGATICTPTSPACFKCPWNKSCMAYAKGLQETLPNRIRPKERPTRYGVVFWLEDDGKVLVGRRPEKGLLGGMLEIPSTEWGETQPDLKSAKQLAPLKVDWKMIEGTVEHTFTHFHLVLKVMKGQGAVKGQWLKKSALLDAGFPSLQKKIIRKVFADDQS